MMVLSNHLKRIFFNKLQLLLIVVLPALFMIPLTMNIDSLSNAIQNIKVGVIDNDNTPFTTTIRNNLATKAKLIKVKSDNMQEELINSRVDYVVVMEKGFTLDFIKGQNSKIKGFYLQESLKSIPLQKYLESYLTSSRQIARASGGDAEKFYKSMQVYKEGPIQSNYKILKQIDRQKSYLTFGLFVLFMLFTTVVYTTMILTDKENKTFYRTVSAPVTVKSYMLQVILSFILVSFIQVTIIFIIFKFVMGVYLGTNFFKMYMLFLAISVACVSFGVAVSSVSKNVIQACFTGLLISFPMSFMGGCWWPNEMSTNVVRTIGKFTPIYWAMEGVNNLLNEKSLFNVSGDILILLIFAVVFFLFGTWRKEDIAK